MQFRSPTFRLLSPFLIERPFIEVQQVGGQVIKIGHDRRS